MESIDAFDDPDVVTQIEDNDPESLAGAEVEFDADADDGEASSGSGQ